VVLANGFMLSRKYYYSSQYMREPGRREDGLGLGGGANSLTLSQTSFLFVSHSTSTSVSSRLYVIFTRRHSQLFVISHKFERTVLKNQVYVILNRELQIMYILLSWW
jgi:hypothetical protein